MMTPEAMLRRLNMLERTNAKSLYHTGIIAYMKSGASFEVTAGEAIELVLKQDVTRIEFKDRTGQGLLPELLNSLL